MFDTYELTDDQYLLHTRYYRRFFWDDKEDEVKPLPNPYWRNIEWVKERLAFDGIRYEDFVKKPRHERFIRKYKDECYDLQSAEDAIRLYCAITGKDAKWCTVEEYAKQLKERKMEHERTECNMGRN